jgi:hypothetical protein
LVAKRHSWPPTAELVSMSANRFGPIRRLGALLIHLLCISASMNTVVNSFVIHQTTTPSNTRKNRTSHIFLKNDLFADVSVPIRTDGVHTSVLPTLKGHQVLDQKGNEFHVDSIVRVSIDGLKAYHVNSKGQGSYNDQKEFVPDTSDSKKKNLLLPVGLRGIVKKVYDEDVISSNLPILVLFTPGEHADEGYDAPTKFLMHFTPFEIEVVV